MEVDNMTVRVSVISGKGCGLGKGRVVAGWLPPHMMEEGNVVTQILLDLAADTKPRQVTARRTMWVPDSGANPCPHYLFGTEEVCLLMCIRF